MFLHYKGYISIELRLLRGLTLIKQVHEKSAIFVIIGISEAIVLRLNQMSAIDVMIY